MRGTADRGGNGIAPEAHSDIIGRAHGAALEICDDLIVDKQEILVQILSIIQDLHLSSNLIYLYGSAKKILKSGSDIDILCIVAGEYGWSKLRLPYGGRIYDIQFLGNDFDRFIAYSQSAGAAVGLAAILDGIALTDTELDGEILQRLRRVWDEGPRVPEAALRAMLAAISALVADLASAPQGAKRISLLCSLFEMLAHYLLVRNNRWSRRSRWIVDDLNEMRPALGDDYSAAFQSSIASGCDAFLLLSDRLIMESGGYRAVAVKRFY